MQTKKGQTKLCAVLKGPTLELAEAQIHANASIADLFEWRLDAFSSYSIEKLKTLLSKSPKPSIMTLRSKREGGFYMGSEPERLQKIEQLASLNPECIDVEHFISPDFLKGIKEKYPKVKVMRSFHLQPGEESSLEEIFNLLIKHEADFYKIAMLAETIFDPLALLLFLKQNRERCPLICVSMGEKGQSSRILNPLFGDYWTYASSDEESLPLYPTNFSGCLGIVSGQLSANTLANVYNHSQLHQNTALFGLIGDPVDKSRSHLTHNAVFLDQNLSAIYVKMPVRIEQLEKFLHMASQVGFKGLSVTMPLKETVVSYLDWIDPFAKRAGAVNTLSFEAGEWRGYNTDGKGAIEAVEEKVDVKGKKIILIGAGGAAKAIACEAYARGSRVIVLNRSKEKAVHFGEYLGCEGGGLEELKRHFNEGYDVLINCTPESVPVDPQYLLPGAYFMDIKVMRESLPSTLLGQAHLRGCKVIPGYHMFVYQALRQFEIWFKERIHLERARSLMIGFTA